MKRTMLVLALLTFASTAQADETLPTEEMANLAMLGGPTHAAQARELILRAGYTDVDDPKRGDDGTWRASAMREDKRVQVTVDKEGNVTQ